MPRRDLEKELYRQLKANQFNFLPRGLLVINSIYELVQNQFPDLCDNNFECFNCCTGGGKGPEWKHVVRNVLDNSKSVNGQIRKNVIRKHWEFY